MGLRGPKPKPKLPCSIEGCPRPARSRTWCNTHYERWRLTGHLGFGWWTL